MTRTTIRASVDAGMLKIADGLFEGGIRTALREIVQNARRAGATKLAMHTEQVPPESPLARGAPGAGGGTLFRLRITDDGHGCMDPALVLRLGGSGWGEARIDERPAGMGLAALARQGAVRISSRAQGAEGWSLQVDEEAFTGQREVEVEPLDADTAARIGAHGFEVSFTAPSWYTSASTVEDRELRHVMSTVDLPWQGIEAHPAPPAMEEWTAAHHVHEGIRYGACEVRTDRVPGNGDGGGPPWLPSYGDVVVYGVLVDGGMPTIEESQSVQGRTRRIRSYAVVEAGSAVQLTLPQRDRLINDPEQQAVLHEQGMKAALAAAKTMDPPFRASGHAMEEAKRHGVTLEPGPARLYPWGMGSQEKLDRCPVARDRAWKVGHLGITQALALGQALEGAGKDGPRVYDAEAGDLDGLEWYDRIPEIDTVTVECAGTHPGRGGATEVVGLQCAVWTSDGNVWRQPIGFALVDHDGSKDYTEEGLREWDAWVSDAYPPKAEEIAQWMAAIFEPELASALGLKEQIETFATEAKRLALAWTGADGEAQTHHEIHAPVETALTERGPGALARRCVTMHWVPGVGLSTRVHPHGTGRVATRETREQAARARRIEAVMRKSGPPLAEVAHAAGLIAQVRPEGRYAVGTLGGKAHTGEAERPAVVISTNGGGDQELAARLAGLATSEAASWWALRVRHDGTAGETDPLHLLSLPVPPGVVDGALVPGGGGEDAALLAAYGLDDAQRERMREDLAWETV